MSTPDSVAVRHQKQAQALRLLQTNPDYASVEVNSNDRIKALIAEYPTPTESIPAKSAAKMDFFIKIFDIRADELARLVTSQATHDAFVCVLGNLHETIWDQWSEGLPQAVLVGGGYFRDQYARIFPRIAHWKIEAYRHLASLVTERKNTQTHTQPSETAMHDPEAKPQKTLRRVLEPRPELLAPETINRKQAALALGITERTLDRWIEDKKLTPYGSGRRKRFKTKDIRKLLNSYRLKAGRIDDD